MSQQPICIHWFRRDLRWRDNRGLHAALASGVPVLPVFVFDPTILDPLPSSDRRVSFLHDTLRDMKKEAKSLARTLS